MKGGCGVLLIATVALCVGCSGGTPARINDPVKGLNKAMFTVNDKLYFWILEPVSSAYAFVMPEYACERVDSLFVNFAMPGRAINALLQGEVKGSGVEVLRFLINTTVGVLGLWDPADSWGLAAPRREDFGQTFAVYGMGPGPYLVVPVLGPSSGRDLVGELLDMVFAPLSILPGASLIGRVNYTSLHLGEYESFKEDAVDPYIALRSAWYQNRLYRITNGSGKDGAKPPLQR